jgi:photosystem II stability/assembly factor-like uncharacterized protein
MYALFAACVSATVAFGAGQGPGADRLRPEVFQRLALRSIGPTLTTGRVSNVEVDPKNSSVYYAATSVGGLWKSKNRGVTWMPIFDTGGSFNMCCVVIDPRDSNVLWLGTGENSNPRSSMYGDGIYKSTDAGKTWAHVGLETSEHIGRILIDPRNSNVVYVASQGPLWAAGGDRGLFKTIDGGKTWKAVLAVSPDTGVSDVVFDPFNPEILYASSWQRRRAVGQFVGGGPESAIYKSTNGGTTWNKLSNGLPQGPMGRIALGVDPKVKPTRVYALINALRPEAGFYRSDDAGATWKRVGTIATPSATSPTDERDDLAAGPEFQGQGGQAGGQGARAGGVPPAGAPQTGAAQAGAQTGQRGRGGAPGDNWYRGGDAGYYQELFVDPIRPDTIWSVNTNLERSSDGGKTWARVPNLDNVHVDFHSVWLNPHDRNHIIVANDGGIYETWDEGKTWRFFSNLPVTQFYRVSVDNAKPFYHVCGGAQDNGSVCGPSRTLNRVGIRTSDWYEVGGGDGFQSRNDPEDPNIVYATSQGGAVTRLDLRTGISKSIRPRAEQPAGAGGAAGRGGAGGGGGRGGAGQGGVAAERTNWDAPYMISPHSATRLYWGSNFLYRSDDRGDTWKRISPDLTRQLDPATIPIMGKLWVPAETVSWNSATTSLSNIVSIDESPLLEGLLYVGTDDGLLQVTEDGGKNWRKVDQFPGVPEGTYVTDVFASPRDVNLVFVALNNWQRGDFKPYLLKSGDRGRTFTSVAGDLPDRQDVWSVIQDHVNGDLLFAGTELGLFFSVDGGHHWVRLTGGLPTVQVRDMTVQKRENDLVLGTFGRSFYVLDDYSPLREVNAAALAEEAHLFPLRNAYLYNVLGQQQAVESNWTAPNPPYGAVFTYHIAQAPAEGTRFVLTITDESGKTIRQLDGHDAANTIPQAAGVQRFAWNLRADAPPPAAAGAAPGGRGGGAAGGGGGFGGRGGGPQGPAVGPGIYKATLGKKVGDTITPLGVPQALAVVQIQQ